jgi:hypothetical protein
VVLQRRQVGPVELRVAEHRAVGRDERHAVAERTAGGVGERVGRPLAGPLDRDEASLARELSLGLLLHAPLQRWSITATTKPTIASTTSSEPSRRRVVSFTTAAGGGHAARAAR